MKAVFNGQVIAESDEFINLEGQYFFPLESVNFKFLRESPTKHFCPWRGTLAFFSLEDGELCHHDAAACYCKPKPAVYPLRNRMTFCHGVEYIE